ncbi:MAG: hypothetical protein WC868_04310 [Bacteroidales bacterium]
MSFEIIYIYDSNGNIIKENNQNRYGRSFFKWTYEFDKINNWVKKTKFEDDIPKEIIEREIEYY